MAISMTEVLAQFSQMSSLRVEIHRDKDSNSKYVQLWVLTILDRPNKMTRSHLLYHDSEMNGFLQCSENSFVRHPGAVWICLGYSSIYSSFLLVFYLQHPQLEGKIALLLPHPFHIWNLPVIERWSWAPSRLVCLLQTSKGSIKALPSAASYFRWGPPHDEWFIEPFSIFCPISSGN